MPARNITLPGGANVPIPRWAIQGFGLIAVVGLAFGVYRYFYPVEPELITTQHANAMLRLEIGEYNKHILETPTATFEQAEQGFKVRAFEDGCLIVARKSSVNGKFSTRLLLDPEREDINRRVADVSMLPTFPVAHAQSSGGRCQNPHPGKFNWRYGAKDEKDACWVQVIRTFEDGCEHVQMFNSCSNNWDTNADGSPRIRWVRCVH